MLRANRRPRTLCVRTAPHCGTVAGQNETLGRTGPPRALTALASRTGGHEPQLSCDRPGADSQVEKPTLAAPIARRR
jgi:hypothetical protein